MKEKELIKLLKKLIKEIDKNWTTDKCEGYAPDCANCRGQILTGLLEDYVDVLEYV